jgi:hypothetical protein
MAELESWLRSIGLGKQIELFRANDIDLDIASHLTESDLIGLGLSLGDRRRLMRAIATLAKGDVATSAPPIPSSVTAERRRLTIMFCDLEVKAVVQPIDLGGAGAALERELIAFCRSKIADYKCPRSIDFSPQLPRDPTGKLYRRLLRDQYRTS